MSKLFIQMLADDAHPVEVLGVNGGREESLAVLQKQGDSANVDIAAPAAVVLRQLPGTEGMKEEVPLAIAEEVDEGKENG